MMFMKLTESTGDQSVAEPMEIIPFIRALHFWPFLSTLSRIPIFPLTVSICRLLYHWGSKPLILVMLNANFAWPKGFVPSDVANEDGFSTSECDSCCLTML